MESLYNEYMPWCPKCGAEFEPGFTVCSDCNAVLVSQPPESLDLSSYSDMVAVASLENEIEANILQSVLEEEGIHSNIHPLTISGYGNIGEGGARCWGELLVLETDFDSAKFILTEYLNSLETSNLPDENSPEFPEDDSANPPE